MKFSQIPGLSQPIKVVAQAIRGGHLAHAQLFAGASGALNLPLALACATYIHCENRGEDACGQCAACSKSLKYIHPDTHFVFPSSKLAKDEKDEDRFRAEMLKSWRSFLLEMPYGSPDDWTSYYGGENKNALIYRNESREIVKALSLKPFESSFKVMIIWQPEAMHPSAANGILKILEEPPPHTYFILVTNATDQLLPTILSRTQILSVPLLSDEEVAGWLSAHRHIDAGSASRVALLADGNLSHAIKLSEGEGEDHTQKFVDWIYACYEHKYGALVTMADEFHELGKLGQRNRLSYSMNMTRETLLELFGAGAIQRSKPEQLDFIRRFAGQMDVKKVEKVYNCLNDAAYHLERNGSAKMIFLELSIKVAGIVKPRQMASA